MSINLSGRHFESQIITMAIWWYLSYSWSYRELAGLLLERGVSVDHSTIQRWVERYAGELESGFRKRHKRHGPYISWGMDDTYVKLRGKWGYLCRAVDKTGATIDFMFSQTRTETAA